MIICFNKEEFLTIKIDVEKEIIKNKKWKERL